MRLVLAFFGISSERTPLRSMTQGKCLCGSIQYSISMQPYDCCYCHCSVCRKLTGSDKGVYGTVAKHSLVWETGQALIKEYKQSQQTTRMFCSTCGSYLASTHTLTPDLIYLSLGCLESDDIKQINYQQFTASKASWVTVRGDIPAHEDWPDWMEKYVADLRSR